MKLSRGKEALDVSIRGELALLGGRRVPFRVFRAGMGRMTVRIGERDFLLRTAREGERVFVWCAGQALEFHRASGRSPRRAEGSGSLAAPMPGRVRRVLSAPGDRVSQGDVVLILEAMKMEHAIRAPRDGTLAAVFHREGDLVEAGAALAEIRGPAEEKR